jgi:hypothetical protein
MMPPAVQTPRLPLARRLLHLLLIAGGWVLFVWGWRRVTAGHPELGELRVLMLSALLVVPVLTLGWVAHNVGIHRRKGPRRTVPPSPQRPAADFNGRRLAADWASLAAARRIDIVLDGDVKRFHARDLRPPSPPVRKPAGSGVPA